jgi:hypothetical protein
MGRCNSRRVSPVNTYDRHWTSNHEQSQVANASRVSPPSLLRHQDYFISFINVHLWLGEQVSEIIVFNNPTPKEWIRFLESDLHNCLIRFLKLFITAHLPLRRLHAEPHRIYHKICQPARGIQESTAIEEVTYVHNSEIMSYIWTYWYV